MWRLGNLNRPWYDLLSLQVIVAYDWMIGVYEEVPVHISPGGTKVELRVFAEGFALHTSRMLAPSEQLHEEVCHARHTITASRSPLLEPFE